MSGLLVLNKKSITIYNSSSYKKMVENYLVGTFCADSIDLSVKNSEFVDQN